MLPPTKQKEQLYDASCSEYQHQKHRCLNLWGPLKLLFVKSRVFEQLRLIIFIDVIIKHQPHSEELFWGKGSKDWVIMINRLINC